MPDEDNFGGSLVMMTSRANAKNRKQTSQKRHVDNSGNGL